MKKARGADPHLKALLEEISWRKLRKDTPHGLLNAFLRDVIAAFDVEQ